MKRTRKRQRRNKHAGIVYLERSRRSCLTFTPEHRVPDEWIFEFFWSFNLFIFSGKSRLSNTWMAKLYENFLNSVTSTPSNRQEAQHVGKHHYCDRNHPCFQDCETREGSRLWWNSTWNVYSLNGRNIWITRAWHVPCRLEWVKRTRRVFILKLYLLLLSRNK